MATFRGALRQAAQVALIAADTIVPAENILVEADWAVTETLPAISVNTRRWRYEDRTTGTGVPQFWSTIWLTVDCRVGEPDAGGTGRQQVIDQLDALSDQVDQVMAQFIIGPPQLFRRLASIEGEMAIDASGEQHQGELHLAYGFEYANDAEAELTERLREIRIAAIRRLKFGNRFGRRFLAVLAGADIVFDDL